MLFSMADLIDSAYTHNLRTYFYYVDKYAGALIVFARFWRD